MNVVRRMMPIVIIIFLCLFIILSRRQFSVEFNTGMPVENIEGLKNALDAIIK